MERSIRERRAKSKPSDNPKPITVAPAERAARFRANLKKNPDLWNDYKKKESERKRYERLNRTEEKKQRDREQSRERQRRYKQRLKENGLQPKQSIKKVQTRSEREKTRAYWKQKQTECRLRKSSQKKRRNKEYDKEYRRDQRTVQSPEMNKAESSESLSSIFTKGALRKAASRVKSKLPKAADKFAESLTYIMEKATPRKKTALKNRGIICSPNKRKENLCREKVIAHFRQQMQEKKSLKRQYLWAMKVMKRYKLSRTTSLIFNVTASDIARCKDPNTERAKRSDCLSSDARKKLDFYYNQPSVSTTLPDKKAVKDQTAKKVLDRPLKDVYDGFQKEHTEVKVGFSTFAANRPQNIKPSKNQPWYSCLCEVCTNVDLKLTSLNRLATKLEKPDMKIRDRYKAVNITLCDKGDGPFHKLECVNRECADCRTDLLMAHLQPLLEGHGQDIVEYTRWDPFRTVNKHGKTVSKVIMVKHRKGLTDTVIELMNQLESLAKHLFNARWQQSQFSGLIKDIPDKWLVLNLDFAENYACVSQMEIQTAHWYHQQVTIHPVVAYYNCQKCQETVQEDIIYISDDLTHDAHAVHKFISLANKHLKESRGLDIQHEVQYSDGCSSQYKSFTPFCDISYALEDFGFPIERNFYGSRHGKGPCDGAGAVVKSAARRAVMGQNSVINNSLEFYEFTKNKLTKEDRPNTDDHLHFKRTMFHVLEQDIPRNRPERIAQTVKGTRSLHCVKTNSSMNVLTRKLSCFCDACQTGHGQCRNFEYVDNWHEEHLLRIGERRVQCNRAVRRGVQPRGRRFGVRGGDAGGLNRRQQQGGRVRGVRTRGGQRGGRGNGGLNHGSPILTVGRMQRGHGRGRLRRRGGRGGRGQTRKDSSSDSSEADNETFEGSENSGSEVSTQDEQPETDSSDDNNDRTERSSDAEFSMILDEPDQVVDAELPDQVVDAELPDQVVDAEFPMILDEPDQVVDAELPDQVVDAELPDQMADSELLDQVVDAEFPMILDDPFTFDLTSTLSRLSKNDVIALPDQQASSMAVSLPDDDVIDLPDQQASSMALSLPDGDVIDLPDQQASSMAVSDLPPDKTTNDSLTLLSKNDVIDLPDQQASSMAIMAVSFPDGDVINLPDQPASSMAVSDLPPDKTTNDSLTLLSKNDVIDLPDQQASSMAVSLPDSDVIDLPDQQASSMAVSLPDGDVIDLPDQQASSMAVSLPDGDVIDLPDQQASSMAVSDLPPDKTTNDSLTLLSKNDVIDLPDQQASSMAVSFPDGDVIDLPDQQASSMAVSLPDGDVIDLPDQQASSMAVSNLPPDKTTNDSLTLLSTNDVIDLPDQQASSMAVSLPDGDVIDLPDQQASSMAVSLPDDDVIDLPDQQASSMAVSDLPSHKIANDSLALFNAGTHVAVKHGKQNIPAVVDEWPWVKFFKKKPGRQILWEMQETRHQVIKEDVAGLLRPPELARCGSRFLYVFEDC